MAKNQVTIMGIIRAKQGKEEELRRAILSTVAPARSEDGCINYDMHQALDDKSRFMSYQNWASMEDLQRHRQMPYMLEYLSSAGQMLAGEPDISLWEKIEEEGAMDTSDKTIISVLDKISGQLGARAFDVPMDAYGDKTGREEVVIRYTVGKGEFGTGEDKNTSALHCAMFKLNGERDGTFEGVWQPQIKPATMLQRPEHPKDPLNKPEGPFPNTYIGAFTKAIWTFGDGSAIIGIGPASLQLVPFADGSHIFLVSVAGLISNGTGRYAGARGVKTALGATYIPQGVDMFNLPPGTMFDAVTVETFRIIPRWARKGTLPPAPQY